MPDAAHPSLSCIGHLSVLLTDIIIGKSVVYPPAARSASLSLATLILVPECLTTKSIEPGVFECFENQRASSR